MLSKSSFGSGNATGGGQKTGFGGGFGFGGASASGNAKTGVGFGTGASTQSGFGFGAGSQGTSGSSGFGFQQAGASQGSSFGGASGSFGGKTASFGTGGSFGAGGSFGGSQGGTGGSFGGGGGSFGGMSSTSQSKVGFGFGGGLGGGQQNAQQQQQQQQQYVLTEHQKRQNKLDHILEKQGKLEKLLPASAEDSSHSLSSKHLPPQAQHYQDRIESFHRDSNGRGTPQGRPLSSGIHGTNDFSYDSPLMSPEVLLRRRAKKLTIDHSQYEDLTEGLPSPYSNLHRRNKNVSRNADEILPARENLGASSTFTQKKARQEEKQEEDLRIIEPRSVLVEQEFGVDEMPTHDRDVTDNTKENSASQGNLEKISPVLSKDGYFTRPDISVLESMSPPELASVPNFTVFVPNVGSITWKGRTDVRRLDLDKIVWIEPTAVTVYPDGTSKPPQNSGLNKPAEITLYNIFPKPNSSQSKQLNFINKLRASNKNTDAKFESYDYETGTWVFSTSHFSRHGLAESDSSDSDDDDDNDAMEDDDGSDSMSLSLQLDGSVNKAKTKHSETLSNAARSQPIAKVAQPLGGGVFRRNVDFDGLDRIRGRALAPKTQQSGANQHSSYSVQSRAFAHLAEACSYNQSNQTQFDKETDSTIEMSFGCDENRSPIPDNIEVKKNKFKKRRWTTKVKYDRPRSLFVDAGKDACSKLFEGENSHCMRLLKLVKERHADPTCRVDTKESATSMRLVAAGRSQRPMDMALYLGRSFRVGWSGDGKILCQGKLNLNKLPSSEDRDDDISPQSENGVLRSVVRVYTLDTMSVHGNDSFYLFPKLLKSLQESSIMTSSSGDFQVPHWRLPICDANKWNEYIRFVNLLKSLQNCCSEVDFERNRPCWILERVIDLVDALYGQEPQWIQRFKTSGEAEQMMPLAESCINFDNEEVLSMWERRRESLSVWLASVCEDSLGCVESSSIENTPESTIFSLLCSGRVDEAVNVAQEASLFRLAMLMCQLGSDDELKYIMNEQLEAWDAHEAHNAMSEEMLSIYKLLGGLYDEQESILANLDWANAIGVLFWYCNSSLGKLSDALAIYNDAREANLNLKPPILSINGDCQRNMQHALFSLLEVFFMEHENKNDALSKVVASLRPRGYSADVLDYRGPYMSLMLLEATSMISEKDTKSNASSISAIVRQHIIGQLLSEGEWAWAIFVCMQIEDSHVRNYAVRDLVLRFSGQENSRDSDSLSSPSQLEYVKNCLQVPDHLLFESTAYYHCCCGQKIRETDALLMSGNWRGAATIICRNIAPQAMFNSSTMASLVQPLLQDIEDKQRIARIESSWNEQGGSLLSFFDVKERAISLDFSDQAAISELVDDAGFLLDQLTHNGFGLIRNSEVISPRHDYSLLANAVIHDMGTLLFKTIVRFWAIYPSLIEVPRLREFLRHSPLLEDYKREVCRVFPILLE